MEIQFFNNDIEKFIRSLEKITIAKTLRTFDLLEQFGNSLGMPHSKKITDGLFELRVRGVQEVRFLYTFCRNQSIIILCGFVKKTDRIPGKHLNKALARKRMLDTI